jgi:hypothetical protein
MRFEVRDLTGKTFGRLTVLEFDHLDDHHHAMWKCECTCGTICVKRSNNLLNGTFSCGCLRRSLGLPAIRKNADLRGVTGADHPKFGVPLTKDHLDKLSSQVGQANPHYKHGLRSRGVKRGLHRAWQKKQAA